MVGDGASHPRSVDSELAGAVDRWGRSVFGAPRRLSSLITAVEFRDEVLHRVFTDVVRRDLREERTFASERPSSPRVPLARVDPFAGTQDNLRADTLHVAACAVCSQSGLVWCPSCNGRRFISCSGCGGAGQFRNPRTNRLNQCKACKGSGTVGCGPCRASGKVMCPGCRGSGHQWVWLVFVESRTPRVRVHPQSPVELAHPQLVTARALTTEDVNAFWLEFERHGAGPLNPDALPPESRSIVQHDLSRVDRRLERVVFQQYIRLGVVRRDVSYQMCGTTGTVAVSGRTLTGASTPEALRPIKRRLVVWPLFAATLFVGSVLVADSATGQAAYFAPTNAIVWMLLLGATLLCVPWVGGLLRAWRPLLRVRGLRPIDVGLGSTWALLLSAIALLGVLTRPNAAAVDEALAAGDVERARVVLDGLVEREGESPAVLEIEDAVLMAEAEAAQGQQRLAKLDQIVSHHGNQAETAAALARADRLAVIRGVIEEGRAEAAIAAIEQDFADRWREDPELAEEWAKAQELLAERCSDDPCRFLARRAALKARETPARVEAHQELRERMLKALATRPDETLGPAERIRAADTVASFAEQVLTSDLHDKELTDAATTAKAWAADVRAAVPTLGADLDTLEALFPGVHRPSPGLITSAPTVLTASVERAELFFTFDRKGRCRGVYAVGPKDHRELSGPTWSAERIVAQAFGKPVALAVPKDTDEVASTWREGKTKVVARWQGSTPVELRIGDAKP